MRASRRALLAALFAATAGPGRAAAFTLPARSRKTNARLQRRRYAVAISDRDGSTSTTRVVTPEPPKQKPEAVSSSTPSTTTGAISVDLTGIATSGLNAQALSNDDFPKSGQVREVIPKECFEPDTALSLGYLSVSLIGTAVCTQLGLAMEHLIPLTMNPLTWPLWAAYAAVTGTVAMGLWVLAHECGHGAFSKNKTLQDAVGYALHSLFLVPYFSWQRSHAVHHQYTNHVELGETHVPERSSSSNNNKSGSKEEEEEESGSLAGRDFMIKLLGKERGLNAWGALQLFLHLVIGWPAYLLIGATGGHDRGMTNHFYPNPLTTPAQPKRELFPGNWKEKVYQSDIGVAAVAAGAVAWAVASGPGPMLALYGLPLLVVNAWLVTYTWLQHTDVDVPHFSESDHTFMKGAFHTIDRPYEKLDPWGLIDFLHHRIGTTHVAHHYDSSIPHYKADEATDAIKKAFPELYLHDPTPIPAALWRVAKGCTAVERRGDKWIWKNAGLEELL